MASLYRNGGKRLADVLAAAVLLLLLAPLIALLLIANALYWRGQPLFRQQRLGYQAQPFALLKLRSMHPGPGEDAARTPAWGRFLRRTHLDELPQLLHILLGQMSFIGPRPLLPHYLPHYSPEEATRHRVRPGLTGWAQVHPHETTWPTRLARDAAYAQGLSLAWDARILVLTVRHLLGGQGSPSMPPLTPPPSGPDS